MAYLAEAETKLDSSEPSKLEGRSHESDNREFRKLDPGMLPRSMSMLDWALWQAKLDRHTRATKQGRPIERDRHKALETRLGSYWKTKVTEHYNKGLAETSFREMCDAIVHTVRKQQPACRARADLLRLHKAEGRSARRQYSHIKAVAKYAHLDTMKVEQLQILLTINSLDQKDYKLRDKVLEAVGEKGEEMNKEVFKRLIGEHKKWLDSGRQTS